MAEENLTTTPGENASQAPPPAEAITPGSNEEKQTQEEGESSRPSRKSSYWGDDYTEILMGLNQIKALADLMTVEIEAAITSFAQQYPGSGIFEGLYEETLPTIGHLIQEKAATIKTLVEGLE